MNGENRETSLDKFMAGWPGVIVASFAIVWTALVVNKILPGLGAAVGIWGYVVDIFIGIFAANFLIFGIVGENTWLGKGIRKALIFVVVVIIAISILSSGGSENNPSECSRATPQYC
ncbi:hypothetical protein [Alloalcanivorax venustensis]|uniref:hypothetical protein n=1 Tax=Alloalcanivorax venustensis TaxID=172371 RepID=UPI003516FEBF